MKSNLEVIIIAASGIGVFMWLMFTIVDTGPEYKCANGIVYEKYMSGDVWIKTKKECLEMK